MVLFPFAEGEVMEGMRWTELGLSVAGALNKNPVDGSNSFPIQATG
jgi:hypothetical protein